VKQSRKHGVWIASGFGGLEQNNQQHEIIKIFVNITICSGKNAVK
jgi:hypothetical protein